MSAAVQQNVAVWFEIPAANFGRAVDFYEKVFATKMKRELFEGTDMAIFPHEGQAVSGAVIAANGQGAGNGTVVYLSAGKDLAVTLSRVGSAGGSVAVPKTALPGGMGFFAQFIDSEGNRVGLHSMS